MRALTTIMIILVSITFAACGSSTKKKVANQEMKTKGDARIELTNQYKECIMKAGGDDSKVKACDSYLEAIKKLK